ncbi:flagellar biosynthesis protein FlgN [Candidatus Pantoea deserta]|uniref:Flagellar biosynthesis protein FlgN n=1 Tax=Candidatus Pantoea deserta TaxID=1869313 RepID=A0A3N4PB84_9GAMM|nr:flagellar export chaperone FlgN [Pantoea deserta]RPE04648.1 flagellar biosynthesis protein FlgN [Pantoea deserta]
MNNLRDTLNTMQQLLEELKTVLTEELNQLQRPQVNPVSLQMLSDNKSRLLAAIGFYDEQRKTEEKQLNISAPYGLHPDLKRRWDSLTATVRVTKEMNINAYPLIELQMKKAAMLKKMVSKAGSASSLYSADGKTQESPKGKAYNINI